MKEYRSQNKPNNVTVRSECHTHQHEAVAISACPTCQIQNCAAHLLLSAILPRGNVHGIVDRHVGGVAGISKPARHLRGEYCTPDGRINQSLLKNHRGKEKRGHEAVTHLLVQAR